MPIMAAGGRKDARSTAWLLAKEARNCLEDPGFAAAHEAALSNIYRLLESLKSNAFFGIEVGRPPSHSSLNTISLIPHNEARLDEVRDAIRSAIDATFENQSRAEGFNLVERVLRAVAYPSDAAKPSEAELQKAKSFFDNVLSGLESD